MASKQPPQPVARKARRAAEREQSRFESDRAERKATPAGSVKRRGSLSPRWITLAAIVAGVLVVAVVAAQQLSMSTTIKDPGIVYAASIQHENALGDPAAPVTLDVYSDFQCPICANYSLNVEPALVAKYVMPGKLRIVHHDLEWIAQSGDRESRIAAAGGVCAARAEQYWTYGHWVFANQLGENVGSFKQDRLLKIAAAAGMDSASLASCMGASDVLAQVDANTAQFVPIVKANQGTPTILLNGVAIASHTVVDLSRAIESALAGPAASPSGSVVP